MAWLTGGRYNLELTHPEALATATAVECYLDIARDSFDSDYVEGSPEYKVDKARHDAMIKALAQVMQSLAGVPRS